jgi:selenide, water dikinase
MTRERIRSLTSLSSCAGCASKLSQKALRQVLPRFPVSPRSRVLVNSDTGDDAGVYRLDRHRALVQTVDFFTPIVDDPFAYGQIAAANALSDVFAMGGQPLTALNIVAFPADLVSPRTISTILRGGLEKAAEAGCAIVGGHTIRNPEPIYGLAVTGSVALRHLMTNAGARPNDLLVLTKPLGTGIVTTAIKRGLCSRILQRKAIALMSTLNSVGPKVAARGLVRAATDITGFGLTGHLNSMCRASGISAVINPAMVPVIDDEVHKLIKDGCVPGGTMDNLKLTRGVVDWRTSSQTQKILLCDAQTSGGLLLAVAPARLRELLAVLRGNRTHCASVIGRITRRGRQLICMKA